VNALLPFSFAFAAGAMLSLILVELLPDAYRGHRPLGPTAGLLGGAAVMMALDLLLGI
jgi:zinc transporter, ZIP family